MLRPASSAFVFCFGALLVYTVSCADTERDALLHLSGRVVQLSALRARIVHESLARSEMFGTVPTVSIRPTSCSFFMAPLHEPVFIGDTITCPECGDEVELMEELEAAQNTRSQSST